MSATPTVPFIHLPLPLTDIFKCNFLVIRNYVISARTRTRTRARTRAGSNSKSRRVGQLRDSRENCYICECLASLCIETPTHTHIQRWLVTTLGRLSCPAPDAASCLLPPACCLLARCSRGDSSCWTHSYICQYLRQPAGWLPGCLASSSLKKRVCSVCTGTGSAACQTTRQRN